MLSLDDLARLVLSHDWVTIPTGLVYLANAWNRRCPGVLVRAVRMKPMKRKVDASNLGPQAEAYGDEAKVRNLRESLRWPNSFAFAKYTSLLGTWGPPATH
jgi:hypothetical protein